MFTDILNTISRGYFKYDDPFTLPELLSLASDKTNSNYHEFLINKKNGGKRLIHAPNKRLMEIQSCIRYLLTGAYFVGTSTTSIAARHVGKDIVYNIDIKDFFPSITGIQITKKLIEKGYNYDVATLLSNLSTMRSSKNGVPVLPQGSPASPALAEIVMEDLDKRLYGYASKHGFSYSRYVDDITFSCKRSMPWFIHANFFKKIIKSEGFEINEKKSRVSFKGQRQEVLGLTVNERLNVSKKYIKDLRTIIHNWEKDGYIKANNKLLMHRFKNTVNPTENIPRMEYIVSGKLSYLKMVRTTHFNDSDGPTIDPVWKKLRERYVALLKRDYCIITGLTYRITKDGDIIRI